MSQDRLIDLDRIKAISGNNDDFMREVLEAFLINTPRDIEKLKENFVSGNLDQTLYFAHKLKSSCSAMGFEQGTAKFQNIEDKIASGSENEEIQNLILDIENRCNEAIVEIKIELANYL